MMKEGGIIKIKYHRNRSKFLLGKIKDVIISDEKFEFVIIPEPLPTKNIRMIKRLKIK